MAFVNILADKADKRKDAKVVGGILDVPNDDVESDLKVQ